MFVIRPAAVWASTAFSAFTTRERALLGWAGLRGAVPIVLGTIVLSSGIGSGKTIFNAVFFVVVVSALAQGTTLERVAELLGLASSKPAGEAPPKADHEALDLVEFDVSADHAIAGSMVRELGLPRHTVVAAVVRADETVEPTAATRVEAGDRLVVMVPLVLRADLEDVFARWRRRV
jgi:cell volume regulation protein A